MTAGLAVHISRLNDSLAFEFSRGISFDFFVVSNADEFVFWELKQVSLQPAPIIDAAMFGAQFPSEMQSQIREAVRDIAIIHNDSEGPVINRIVFGEVP